MFRKNNKGFALITSYILISSLLTLVTAFFFRSFNNMRMTDMRLERVKAAFIAEAAAEKALVNVRDRTEIPTNLQPFCGGAPSSSQQLPLFDDTFDQGTISATLTTDCNRPNQVFWVLARGSYNGSNREIRIAVKLEPFYKDSKFVIDRMHPDTYLSEGSDFDVPLHVNGPIQAFGFEFRNGPYLTSAPFVKYYGAETSSDGYTPGPPYRDIQFGNPDGGWAYNSKNFTNVKLNQPRISFPRSDLSYLKSKSDIKVIDKKAWTIFNADNSMSLSYDGPITEENLPDQTVDLSSLSGVYFTGRDPSDEEKPGTIIQGEINKTLLVASKNDIAINGDITYTCSSCTAEDPVLGVVSEKNIVVLSNEGRTADDAPRLLYGAYMAVGGSFLLEPPIQARPEDMHPSLSIYGSVSQALMQGLHQLDAEEAPSLQPHWRYPGYFTSIFPDPRFNSQTISYFPIATSILAWEDCNGVCSEYKDPTPVV